MTCLDWTRPWYLVSSATYDTKSSTTYLLYTLDDTYTYCMLKLPMEKMFINHSLLNTAVVTTLMTHDKKEKLWQRGFSDLGYNTEVYAYSAQHTVKCLYFTGCIFRELASICKINFSENSFTTMWSVYLCNSYASTQTGALQVLQERSQCTPKCKWFSLGSYAVRSYFLIQLIAKCRHWFTN